MSEESVFNVEKINAQLEKLEYAKQDAIGFFIWYGVKIINLVDYVQKLKIGLGITSNELEEKILEFEGKPIDELYTLYQKEKSFKTNDQQALQPKN